METELELDQNLPKGFENLEALATVQEPTYFHLPISLYFSLL